MKIKAICGTTIAILSLVHGNAFSETPSLWSKRVKAGGPPNEGLTYFLPKRLAKITVIRTPLDLPTATKENTGKQTAWDTTKEDVKKATAERESAEAILAQMTPTDPGYTDAQGDVSKAAAKEKALKVAEEAAHTKADTALKNLNQIVTSGTSTCSYAVTMELLAAQADPSQQFVVNPQHSIFRDDAVKLASSPAGLVTSTNVVATDRTGDVFVELAGILGITQSGGIKSFVNVKGAAVDPCGTLPKTFISIFDPAVSQEVTEVETDLKASQLPFLIDVKGLSNSLVSAAVKQDEGGAGIYYRSPIGVRVAIYQCTDASYNYSAPCETKQPVAASILNLPQAGPTSMIPFRSNRFVKTVTDVQFSDGVISKWDSEQPSEAIAFISLPIKALKAFISIPAEIFSLKIDLSTKQKSYAEIQVAQMQYDKELEKTKRCVDLAAATDATGEASLACFKKL